VNREDIYDVICQRGVLFLFYEGDSSAAMRVVEACLEGGGTLLEFVNRGPSAMEVFREIRRRFPGGDLCLGLGTVKDPETASRAIHEGADFIVSPFLDREIGRACHEAGTAWLPGCATATEIHTARQLGAGICKVFPADAAGGPSFIRAIRGPMPEALLLPTGGVDLDEDNLRDWFEAGACAVGMGSRVLSRERIQGKRYPEITDLVRRSVELVSGIIQEVR
jgi:2-dehydro-3-deoxyphosphogluconate aldolase/(4S)-4-hydroxy-2-oxoglutarate aldolase